MYVITSIIPDPMLGVEEKKKKKKQTEMKFELILPIRVR